MPGSASRLRTALALGLAGPAALVAALMLAPPPTYRIWYWRVVARETSLATTLAAVLALVLTRGTGAGWPMLCSRGLALFAAAAGLMPPLAILPLSIREGRAFSPVEYALGLSATPVRVERDVVLDSASPLLTADVYHGAGSRPCPFVVVVHGGSWRGGDKGGVEHVSRRLAAAGFTVVDVRYSVAPEHRFPRAVREVKCFLGRLRERAATLAIDPGRAALLGRSAGGQIALVAAYSAGDPRIPPSCPVEDRPVQGVVSLYAPTDLAWGHANPLRPDIVQGPESLELYLGGPPSRVPEAYRLGSPLSWAERPLPRTLLIHGSGDRLVSVEHTQRLAAGLARASRPVRTLVIPLAEHGFDFRPGGVGEQLARGVILEFLRAQ